MLVTLKKCLIYSILLVWIHCVLTVPIFLPKLRNKKNVDFRRFDTEVEKLDEMCVDRKACLACIVRHIILVIP